MAQVIMEGTQTSDNASRMKRSLEKGHNRPSNDDKYEMVKTEYYVYLYTVCKRQLSPVSHALLPYIEIPVCGANERYRRFGLPIPEPFPQRVEDVLNTGREPYDYHRDIRGARRIAQDICQPSNPTLNQDIDEYAKIDPFFAVQNGTNLSKHGVFWSLNAIPTEDELLRSERKRDNFYRFALQSYDKFWAENPKMADVMAAKSDFDIVDVRTALNHFGEERSYFQIPQVRVNCPNCGEKILQSVAYHRDQDGDICVIDWQRTVNAGKKTLQQVPVDMRWEGFKLPPGRPASQPEA